MFFKSCVTLAITFALFQEVYSAVGVVTWPQTNGNAWTDFSHNDAAPFVLYGSNGPDANAHFPFTTTSGDTYPVSLTLSYVILICHRPLPFQLSM